MKYYTAVTRKEVLTHVTTWLNLKDITPSEESQSLDEKYCAVPLTCGA